MIRLLSISALLVIYNHFPVYTGNTYYVSSAGNDSNDGKSILSAWKSLEKINTIALQAGDNVLLEGNTVFTGSIILDALDKGTSAAPIRISSFGKGKAIIDAGKGKGIFVYNTQGIAINNLSVKGAGVVSNPDNSGIELLIDDSTLQLSGFQITDCFVSGFGQYGILVNGRKSEKCGLTNVVIKNCEATLNGEGGIGSLTHFPAIAHRNVKVLNCKTYKNRGILAKTSNHSGNGIVIGGVEDVLIDHCESYENGEDNRSEGGGPVGIWVWCCRNAVIQYCNSHNNYAGLKYDGGGYDIDGGSVNCTIRYCRSSNNEGAGYLICEFGYHNHPYYGNSVINCTSTNDGLKNNYGAITISGTNADYKVTNTIIRGNKIYTSSKNVINGTPAAIYLYASHFRNIQFQNNVFVVGKGTRLLLCDTMPEPGWVFFTDNKYQLQAGPLPVQCSQKNSTEAAWKKIMSIR